MSAFSQGSCFRKCDKKKRGSGSTTRRNHLVPTALFRHLHERQFGLERTRRPEFLAKDFTCRHIPMLLRQNQYNLGDINKIFASQWLSDRQVVFGTKCNMLMILDLLTRECVGIPTLKSTENSQPADCPSGIHSIAINPSRTLLATGAENTNDVAVYKLPSFDPVCVGELAHVDWIFDIKWLDDEFLVTGSRDSTIALWNVQEGLKGDLEPAPDDLTRDLPVYTHIRPSATSVCRKADKVRAMVYNENTQELVALSLNANLHLWDANKFVQKMSHRLVHTRENVCLAMSQIHNIYGVGSQSHITLVDPRSLRQINHIVSKQKGIGIRSLNFQDNVISVGTGAGSVMFYDIRMGSYLEHDCGHLLELRLGKGWLREDDNYRDYFYNTEYPNAVYTHSFDEAGTKIFAAGGPLPAGLWGNYAGLWS